MNKKNNLVIGSSSEIARHEEKTHVQMKNAQSLMSEVHEDMADEAPTSIRPINELEAPTRQFHSQIIPVVQNYFPQETPYNPQIINANIPLNEPDQKVIIAEIPQHINQIPYSRPAVQPVFSQPKVKFPANEDTIPSRPQPQIHIPSEERQANLQEIFSKSNYSKTEVAIKTTMVAVCGAVLAVILTLKLNNQHKNALSENTVPDNLPINSNLSASSTANSVEASQINTPTEASAVPSVEIPAEANSAETASSAAPSTSVAQPSPTPSYLKPSALPSKLDPSDPYAETTSKPPVKPSAQKPTSTTSGIMREVPF
jgi:hypothetical protein